MLVICIDNNSDFTHLLELNKVYVVSTETPLCYYLKITGDNATRWWFKNRFKKINLYPNTELFKKLYPDHILYQNTIGVISEA